MTIASDDDREGDRLTRIANVFSFSMDVYKDQAKACAFLGRPHAMLEGKTPLDVAVRTATGPDVVINLLGRAAYGGGV